MALTPEQENRRAQLLREFKNYSYNQLIEKLATKIIEVESMKAEIKDLKEKGSSEAVRKKRDEYNEERILYREAIKQTIRYLQGKVEGKKKEQTQEEQQA